MTKYYVYAQTWSDSTMASCYDAYTDNPFLMKEYVEQMDTFLKRSGYVGPCVRNNLLEIEEENEESLLNLLLRMKIGFSMSKENKLWSIHSEFAQSTVITNQSIYSKFIETIVIKGEVRKIDANIYRLSRPANLTYITRYMNPNIADDIIHIIKLLYETHRRIKDSVERNGDYYGLISKDRKESELWFLINESMELSRFIEMDVLKIFKFFSAPFK